MKQCQNCGTQLPDAARFCSKCGADQAVAEPRRRGENRRSTLGLILAALALCLSVLAVCFALGLFGGRRPAAPEETPLPAETVTPDPEPTATSRPTATPVPTETPDAASTETPAPTPDRAEALNALGVSTKGLTPEMAAAYAGLILAEPYPVVRAAMFDGGGVPVIWIAHGDAVQRPTDREILDGDYGDQPYAYLDGRVVECPWITTLLREGEDAVVAQSWGNYYSDFRDDFRLYHMKNGQLEPEPFATGTAGFPAASCVLNGQPVGSDDADDYLTLLEVYRMVDPELEILLDASSGLADMLFLSGSKTWYEGRELAEALLAYAG